MLVPSWGCINTRRHYVITLDEAAGVAGVLAQSPLPGIAHGMGRSYGDECLNPDGTLWLTTGLDRFVAFDVSAGLLTCEAGVVLRDIQRLIVARGWMLPVTPGTQLVTVGGAIANDIHGKNHHAQGTFGEHVERLTLVRTSGEVIECGPRDRSEWFFATVGGLGLTGVITQATIKLRRVSGPWLEVETVPYGGLDEFFSLSQASEAGQEYVVSWFDCLSGEKGRGVFMRANHTSEPVAMRSPEARELTMPFVPPVSLVNQLTLRPFNMAYYLLKKRRAGRAIVHYEPFFYPLDGVLHWNRIYGPKGFYQYQSVLPMNAGPDATRAMLGEIARAGEGSFLAVLKTFGNRKAPGMLSFPEPGVTLALDFPNRGERTHRLFARLDAIVREAGGRLYPAKDARMPRALFEAGYPNLPEFLPFRDPGISSAMSRRLLGN